MKNAVRIATIVAVLAAVGAAGAATSTSLTFRTVSRGEQPVGPDEPYWRPLKPGEFDAVVLTTAAEPTYYYYAFPKSAQARIDAVDFDKQFVFAVWTKQRTTGYTLKIKRVVLQRISRAKRQLCVIASLQKPAPGDAVVVRPTFVDHIVALSSRRFRVGTFQYAIPNEFVVRSTNGKLFAASRHGGSFNNMFVSSKPKLCTTASRETNDLSS